MENLPNLLDNPARSLYCLAVMYYTHSGSGLGCLCFVREWFAAPCGGRKAWVGVEVNPFQGELSWLMSA